MTKANPFRFSTKYQDDETDLLYYGYRYYNASTGRWVSVDPLCEQAFQQQVRPFRTSHSTEAKLPGYLFAHNDSMGSADYLGLLTMHAKLCTITIFYGHGTEGKPYKWDSAGPCCAGTFIGCYNADTVAGIPVGNRIPGVPTTDDTMTVREMHAAVGAAWRAAYQMLPNLCKKCRCVCSS